MKKKSMILVLAMCVALFAGQSMALTTDIELSDWTQASNIGAGDTFGTNQLFSGYYYSTTQIVDGYMKFDLSSLAGAVVNSVSLSFWSTTIEIGAPFSDNLYTVADDSWTRATLTNANKPAYGSVLETYAWASSAQQVLNSAALAAYVQQEANGDGIMSLGMNAADAVFVSSLDPRHTYYCTSTPGAWTTPVLSVDYVPEPATMCLLALGGLFLRKRR